MSQAPTQYSRQSNFETWSTNNPNTPHSGVSLDAEYNAVKAAMDSTQLRLAEIQREDGVLRNQIVTIDSLNPAVLTLIQRGGGTVRGNWLTATAYAANDLVNQGGGTYLCAVPHTSGTFATDQSAGRWLLIQAPASANAIVTQRFTGNGSQTVYTLSNDPSTANNTWIYIDGVYQQKDSYTVNGTTLTFSEAPPNGSGIEVNIGIIGVIGSVLDGSISTPKLAAGAVTGPTIAASAVGLVNLASETSAFLVPVGAVMAFAMNSAPTGWLACDGSAVSRATYAALWSALGTTHGSGDGSSTFNLPDLRGLFVRGSGSQVLSGTTYTGTFASRARDAMQGHRHSLSNNNAVWRNGGGNAISTGGVSAPFNLDVGDPTTDGTNGTPRTAAETRPANIALLYCIKF